MYRTPDAIPQAGTDALSPLFDAQFGAWQAQAMIDAHIATGGSPVDPSLGNLGELIMTPTQIANILDAVTIPEVES